MPTSLVLQLEQHWQKLAADDDVLISMIGASGVNAKPN